MAYGDVILADGPLRYWPLNNVSGTSATELVAGETGIASGMTMGGFGEGAPPGIGGASPNFNGAGHILLRNGKLLGGLASFTIEAWFYYTGSFLSTLYAEAKATAGGDWIRARLSGGTSGLPGIDYGDDAASASQTGQTTYAWGGWVLGHFIKNGTDYAVWWAGGKRGEWIAAGPGTTWTTPGVQTWLGMHPTGADAWIGSEAHLAVYDYALSEAQIVAHHEAGTPLTRSLINFPLWRSNAIWNQRVDDAANPPAIAGDSAAVVSNLVAQVNNIGAASQQGGGPIYLVDNSTPTQVVRMVGGIGNVSDDPPVLWNYLQAVPIPPAGMKVSTSGDEEVSIYNTDTDRLYEFWHMGQTLMAPAWATQGISGAGTIPAGTYDYLIVPALSDDTEGNYKGCNPAHLVLNGSQGVRLDWDISEGAAKYRIYRSSAGFSPLSNYKLIATVAAPTQTYTDSGAVAGASYAGLLTAVTTDWGCAYAGVMENVSDSVGHFVAPHANWGAAATSLPMMGGVITLEEGMAHAIPHAITMALQQIVPSAHVYPAQRNDGFGGTWAIMEGTRFRLRESFDVSTIANRFERAVATAFQQYGGYIRDVAGIVTACYVEDDQDTGRFFTPYIYDGKQSYEMFSTATFPWDQMEVVDPAWTLEQAGAAVLKLGEVTDNFDDDVLDAAKWPTATFVTESGGAVHLRSSETSYAELRTQSGRTLRASSMSCKISQRPTGDAADQSGMSVVSVSAANCDVSFWVGNSTLIASYRTGAGITEVATAVYDAASHRYARIREDSGTVFFETSSTGTAGSWSLFASFVFTTSGWPITNLDNVFGQLWSGNFNGVAGRPDMVADDFNTVTGPSFSSLTDNFEDSSIDPSKWTVTAGVSETGGKLRIATAVEYPNATTFEAKLTGSSLAFEFGPIALPQDIADQSGVRLTSVALADVYVDFRVQDSRLVAVATDWFGHTNTLSETTTYNSSLHRGFRIHETSGTVFFETWNGVSWTVLTSVLWSTMGWPASHLDLMTAMFYSGNYAGVVGRPEFVIDNVNLVAPVGGGGPATLVVSRPDLWPDGTVVSAYPGLAVVRDRPTGAAAESATAVAGSVSFTTLVAGTAYVLHAVVGGQSRILRVRVQSVSAAALGRATGTGNVAAGSLSVSNVVTVTGAFQVGQRVMGPGIEPLTRIKAISGSTLTLTNAAKVTGVGVSLEASDAITAAGRVLRRRAAIGTS